MTLFGSDAGKEVGNIAVFGYIRVSTKEQNEDRQLIALHELNIPEKNIYMDKQSGKDFDRPQYKRLMHSTSQITETYYVRKDTSRLNGITDGFEM